MPEVSGAHRAAPGFPRSRKVQSIRQNHLPDALPDFKNLGVISRILLSVNALALLFALARSREIGEFAARVAEIAGSLEPILLVVVILLYAGSTLLSRETPAALVRRDGKIAGIVTRYDVLHQLARMR